MVHLLLIKNGNLVKMMKWVDFEDSFFEKLISAFIGLEHGLVRSRKRFSLNIRPDQSYEINCPFEVLRRLFLDS